MSRSAFWRSQSSHETIAAEILRRHAARTGAPIGLPVPVELIIEQTYELTVLWDEVDEPSGSVILGALAPAHQQIIINTKHAALLESVMGPERFTLAHELAHWVYDADDPDQLTLDFAGGDSEVFCYHRGSTDLKESTRMREVNANKLAAALLLPEELVRRAYQIDVRRDLRENARGWGVSYETLRIRLETLGLFKAEAGPLVE